MTGRAFKLDGVLTKGEITNLSILCHNAAIEAENACDPNGTREQFAINANRRAFYERLAAKLDNMKEKAPADH